MRYRVPARGDLPWRISVSNNTERVYRAILDYCADHSGCAPTVREIQEMTGISSTSVVTYHIRILVHLGRLEIRDRKLIVVGATWIAPEGSMRE